MGGQRIATFLMYLSPPGEGGTTLFPQANLEVFPQKGDALLFYNVDLGGENDLRSLHASSPVLEGAKWAAVKWIREDYWGL